MKRIFARLLTIYFSLLFATPVFADNDCKDSAGESKVYSLVIKKSETANGSSGHSRKGSSAKVIQIAKLIPDKLKKQTPLVTDRDIIKNNHDETTKSLISFTDFLIHIAENPSLISEEFTQNMVWTMHANYIKLKRDTSILNSPQSFAARSLVAKLNKNVAKMESLLEESQLFQKIQERGFSLIPKANDKVKKIVDDPEYAKKMALMGLMIDYSSIGLTGFAIIREIYPDLFRKRYLTRGPRLILLDSLVSSIEGILEVAGQTLDKYDPKIYDLVKLQSHLYNFSLIFDNPLVEIAMAYAKNGHLKSSKQAYARVSAARLKFQQIFKKAMGEKYYSLKIAELLDSELGLTENDFKHFSDSAEKINSQSEQAESLAILLKRFEEKLESTPGPISSENLAAFMPGAHFSYAILGDFPLKKHWADYYSKREIELAKEARKSFLNIFNILLNKADKIELAVIKYIPVLYSHNSYKKDRYLINLDLLRVLAKINPNQLDQLEPKVIDIFLNYLNQFETDINKLEESQKSVWKMFQRISLDEGTQHITYLRKMLEDLKSRNDSN